jgi:hypothetical protein
MRYCCQTSVFLSNYRRLKQLCCQSFPETSPTDVQRLRNPLDLLT